MWSLEGNLTKQEKKETAGKIKELLEPIKEKVPGAVKVEVIINELDSSKGIYWIRGRQQSLPGLRVLRMVLVYGMVSEM